MWSTLLVLLLVWRSCIADRLRGAQVLRFSSATLPSSLLTTLDVDIWSRNANFTDVMVMMDSLPNVKKTLARNGIGFEVMIRDVQAMVNREKVSVFSDNGSFRDKGGVRFEKYNKLGAILEYLDMIGENHADIVTVGVMGYSHENRPLKYIKISSNKPDAKAFFIDAGVCRRQDYGQVKENGLKNAGLQGIHAREWISPAVALYVIWELVENRSNQPQEILDLDFYILPVFNPDGYHYTFTTDRLWRKNRSKPYQGCRGVDLNRNFGYMWGGKGSSADSCSSTFRGQSAFSEPESSAVADFLSAFRDDIQVYLTLHSYSQLILLPYAYNKVRPENFNEMKEVGDAAALAMLSSGGQRYEVGNAAEILYDASGGSFDWALGEAGIEFSYTIELRDTGKYGFLLPASMIIPTSKETFEAIKAIAKAVRY